MRALILMILILASCQSTTKNDNECYSKVTSLMIYLDNQKIDIDKGVIPDSFENTYLVFNQINKLSKDIIERSGGIQINSDQLFNGCNKSKYSQDYFNNYLEKNISPIYMELEEGDPLIVILNKYFYAPHSYFNDEYFQKTKIFQLATDLFIMQLEVLHLIKNGK